ncbi:MAG: LysR family transcriptional regulator [Sulfitobacter sp.]
MPVKPPRPRGPHLNAMRCFEASARLGGFSAAADELSVTPGAVSQQVKALEDWVGAPLFERRSQGVALTPLGREVADDFTAAFDALGGALHQLRAKAPHTKINIAALPSIAQLWLGPRLPAVRAAFPGLSISVTAMETPPNLNREMFDLSVFFGTPSGQAAQQVLQEDVIFPVCTPALAAQIKTPEDLLEATLIYDATWSGDWALWLQQAGFPQNIAQPGPVFSLYAIAIQEAMNGAGVMIGHEALIGHHLQSGALVAPFGTRANTGNALILESAGQPKPPLLLRQITEILRA